MTIRTDKHRVNFIRSLLRPAMRFALRFSVGFIELSEILKALLVEIAQEEIAGRGEKVTVSRLSLMTSLNRREVARIFREGETIDLGADVITRLIGQWEQDQRFLTKTRQPRVLSYKGDRSEFKKLCDSVSKEFNPASMLYELERLGLISRVRDGLRLEKREFLRTNNPEKGIELLAKETETISRVVEENLFSPREPRNLHLRTEYDNIFQNHIPEIREWVLRRGVMFHEELRSYLAQFDKDINPDPNNTGGAKVSISSFGWTSE